MSAQGWLSEGVQVFDLLKRDMAKSSHGMAPTVLRKPHMIFDGISFCIIKKSVSSLIEGQTGMGLY